MADDLDALEPGPEDEPENISQHTGVKPPLSNLKEEPAGNDQTPELDEHGKPVVKQEEPKPEEDWKTGLRDLTNVVKTIIPKKDEQQPKQPTKEELAKQWAVFNPTEQNKEFFHKFFGLAADADPKDLEERQALFAYMQEGLVKQAIIGARNLFAAELAKRDEVIQQLQAHYSETQTKSLRENFGTAYSAFADKKYDRVLAMASEELAGQEFDSQEKYFDALAERAAGFVREFVPDFDPGKPQPKKPGTPRLPRTSVGGSGGAGGSQPTQVTSAGGDIDTLG